MNFVNHQKEQEKVLSLLLMRFNILPYRGMPLVDEWLKKNTQNSYSNLEELILMGGVILKDEELCNIYPTPIIALVKQMRGTQGLEIKDRWYRFKVYPQCFVGSSAVEWLMYTQKVNKKEAIELGQKLVDFQIIHHVVDEHPFRDGYFFYRFYIDE